MLSAAGKWGCSGDRPADRRGGAGLARAWLDDDGGGIVPGTTSIPLAEYPVADSLARYVLSVHDIVAAAVAQTRWMDGQTGIETWPEGAELIDATTAAVRARDGAAGAAQEGEG